MTLLRYSKRPSDFFTNQLMNQIFRETQGSFRSVTEGENGFRPVTNVIEEDNYYLLEMAIPGFSKQEVNITVENGSIMISAEKKTDNEDRKFLKREFGIHSFERSFKLADIVNQENISAEVKDGILNIVLPKHEEKKPKVKNIKVR